MNLFAFLSIYGLFTEDFAHVGWYETTATCANLLEQDDDDNWPDCYDVVALCYNEDTFYVAADAEVRASGEMVSVTDYLGRKHIFNVYKPVKAFEIEALA